MSYLARCRTAVTRVAAAVFVLSSVMLQPSLASATTTSYYSGTGYDTSYPQCSATTAPTGFAVVGVTHGRPFSSNTCAGAEWKLAPSTGPTPSLYFNTGYALAYAKQETPACQTLASNVKPGASNPHQSSVLQTAFAIGCSEVAYAVANEPGVPTMWWADVESGNSWSSDVTVNQFTINGIAAELDVVGVPFGVYSSPKMWTGIVGSNYVNAHIAYNWEAGLSGCSSNTSGFSLTGVSSSASLLLAQTTTTTVNGVTFDVDAAC